MKLDHLFQFDIPEGVKTITVGNKKYSREEFNNLKNSNRKESLTKKVFKNSYFLYKNLKLNPFLKNK